MRAVFSVGVLLLSAGSAVAAVDCGPHEEMTSALINEFGETQRSIGLHVNGALVEVFASDEGDRGWTILLTPAGMPSCIVAHGSDYHGVHSSGVDGDPA